MKKAFCFMCAMMLSLLYTGPPLRPIRGTGIFNCNLACVYETGERRLRSSTWVGFEPTTFCSSGRCFTDCISWNNKGHMPIPFCYRLVNLNAHYVGAIKLVIFLIKILLLLIQFLDIGGEYRTKEKGLCYLPPKHHSILIIGCRIY